MQLINKKLPIPFLALLVVALAVSSAQGAVLFSETFDGAVAGSTKGGRFVETFGPGNFGWQGNADQSKVKTTDYIQYSVADGVQYLSERGTLEFWLKNDRPGGLEFGDKKVNFNTVFQWVTDDSTLVLYVLWRSDKDESQSALVVWGNRYGLSKNPLGFYNHLGRKVPLGEWIHVAITWGSDPGDNNILINGELLALDVPVNDQVNFGKWFAGAHTLRIGADNLNRGSYPDGTDVLYNSVIDDLKIHDEIITAFDLTRIKPVIKSVGHNVIDVAGYSGKLVEGDSFTVTMKAEPGGSATFELGNIKNHPMTENSGIPGEYNGTHTIKYGEDFEDGQIIGYLANNLGYEADPVLAPRKVNVETKVYITVNSSNDLIPADRKARSGLTVTGADANGKKVQGHQIKMTLSTTDEYTGTLGGGSFEDFVGGELDVDWGGVTDSFGEVTAQYVSGFAAKTILVSAKDMVSGDVGVGWIRSHIDGSVDIVVTKPTARALSVTGAMDVTMSREWLTADGRSRSRITAVVKDVNDEPISGHSVQFTLLGDNGEIRVIQSKTDSKGRAIADYIAGTVMGQVQIEVRDLTSGMVTIVPIELRPDAPAEIKIFADPGEVVTGGNSTVIAKVTDANGNPNQNVDVLYNISVGEGQLESSAVATDEDGNAPVVFTAGDVPGLVTVRGTVISREPTAEEISAAEGPVFLYGLGEDPGRLDVLEWLVNVGDEVVEGQNLVVLESRDDTTYTVVAPRDGIVSIFTAEERGRVEYGDTLGYVIEIPE